MSDRSDSAGFGCSGVLLIFIALGLGPCEDVELQRQIDALEARIKALEPEPIISLEAR